MTNIISIKGDFKLDAIKIHEPFRESYLQTIALPTRFALKSNGSVSNQFADNSLQLVNLNLIQGELRNEIIPDEKSLKMNGIWYFNHFIQIKSLLGVGVPLPLPPNSPNIISQKGPGLAGFTLLDQLAELNSNDRINFLDSLPPGLITPTQISLLKNTPDISFPAEIKKNIEDKLSPYFEEFKAN